MKFTMPTAEELAKLTAPELDKLAEQAAAEINVFQARHKAGDAFTPEEVERFEYLANSHETIAATSTALVEAEQTSSDKLSDLIDRTTPKPAAPAEPEAPAAPEAPEAPADPAPVVEAEAEVVAEAEAVTAETAAPVAVAAGATTVNFASATTSSVPEAPSVEDPDKPWALLPSAPNFAAHKGQGVSYRDIALSIASVDPGSGQGVRQTGTANGMAKQAIATIARPQTTMAVTSEQQVYDFLQTLGKTIPGHGEATAAGLVAAGGWCAPSQQLYGFCDVPEASGLISLPDFPFDMSRGGVKVPVNPDITALLTAMWHFTEAQLEAVDANGDPTAVKQIMEIPCPEEFLEWRLEAIGWAAKAGILQRQAWPEAIEIALKMFTVAHQHRVSQLSIGKMVAGSGTPLIVPTDAVLGATSSVLNGLDRNAVNLRVAKGLALDATVEGVAPIWFRNVLRADLALRDGKDMLAVSNAEVDSWLAARDIYLQYVTDWQKLDTDEQVWPDSADVLLYPAGTWFRQLQNIITIGVQYPLQQLQLNQYTHIFTEDSFQVGKRCDDSIIVTVPLCVNGAVGARESIVCGTEGA